MPIDWKALLVGVGVSFSPVMILALLSAWIGDLPITPLLDRVAVGAWAGLLVLAAGPFLGALAAGYLHSSRLVGCAVYGVGVATIGFFLPGAIVVVLFVGIGGVGWVVDAGLAGLYIYGLVVAWLLVIPVVVTLVLGSIGGILGSLLRRH